MTYKPNNTLVSMEHGRPQGWGAKRTFAPSWNCD